MQLLNAFSKSLIEVGRCYVQFDTTISIAETSAKVNEERTNGRSDEREKFVQWIRKFMPAGPLNIHIEYKVISTTCKLLQSSSPRYPRYLVTVRPSRSTRSSTLVTLLQPSVDSSVKTTDRSFRYAALYLWNKLSVLFPDQSGPSSSPSSSSSSCSDLGPLVDVTHGVFTLVLKLSLPKVFPSVAICPLLRLISRILPLVISLVSGGVILASAAD